MKNLTIIISVLLIALGLVGYFAWEAIGASIQSKTALIPTWIGLAIFLSGLICIKNHKVGGMLATLFGVIGALAGIGRLVMSKFAMGPSNILVLIMAVLCIFFVMSAFRAISASKKG